MAEPAKPFACSIPDCGMSFTNEDHLHVHTKKHDMVLQLGMEQKAAFVADQTPTPTRFIRNCEEVGLFQDLQNVAANPFDEGFKRAMEAKNTILSLESAMGNTDDVLHTPQMVFPLLDNAESTLFTNNQRNITISRSSSDESGTIKEFETRTISKLTNEVITISRVVNNIQNENASKQTNGQELQEVGSKNEISVIRTNADGLRSVLFPENVVKEAVNKANHVNKDNIADNSKLHVDKVPIMSQKSIDFVVDSLTSELTTNANQIVDDKNKKETKIDKCEAIKVMTHVAKKDTNVAKGYLRPKIMPKETRSAPKIELNEFEVIIKMPDGKRVKMKPVEEEIDTKSHLRNAIVNKAAIKIANLNQVLVNQAGKVPIQPLKNKPAATQAVKNIFHVTNQHVKNKLPVTSQPVKSKPVTSQIVKNNSPVTSQVATPVNNIVNLTAGTLIPVTLVNQQGTPLSNEDLTKVRITKIGNNITTLTKLPANGVKKVKSIIKVNAEPVKTATVTLSPSVDTIKVSQPYQVDKETGKRKLPTPGKNIVTLEDVDERLKEHDVAGDVDTDCVISDVSKNPIIVKRTRLELESRCAASKRYRERLKEAMMKKTEENRLLFEANQRLIAEKAVLKLIITEHMKGCPNASDIVDRLNTLTNGQSL